MERNAGRRIIKNGVSTKRKTTNYNVTPQIHRKAAKLIGGISYE